MNWQKGVRVTKKGTVWVIGASSGLGLHTAQAFAESGWLVIAGARSFEEAQSSFEMKASENPIRLSLDVTSEESCDRFQREALRISPRVDVLVCGAAVPAVCGAKKGCAAAVYPYTKQGSWETG